MVGSLQQQQIEVEKLTTRVPNTICNKIFE